MSETAYIQHPWILTQLQATEAFFATTSYQTFLVGGSVRNLLLSTACTDFDIAVACSPTNVKALARGLADHLGGFYVPMHDKASRVIIKHPAGDCAFDLSPLQGQTIEEDLTARDFTLNALALPFAAFVLHLTDHEPLTYIDPLGGVNDAQERILRVVSAESFVHDPLRMLRGLRFQKRYGLTLEPQTRTLYQRDASLLMQSAPARIHEELYTLLTPDHALTQLRALDSLGLLTVLFPELAPARSMQQPSLHYWDVFDHSLETVATLERLVLLLSGDPAQLADSPLNGSGAGDLEELHALLLEAEGQGYYQPQLMHSPQMKLAALFHDIGKPTTHAVDDKGHITFYHHPQAGVPIAQKIMQRLNASVQDRRLVQQVVGHHMRPGQLSNDTLTIRAIRRYFVDLGPTGIVVALVSLADHLSMRGPQPLTVHWHKHLATVRTLLTHFVRERDRILPPRLIQADDLMRRLHITPGPIIGQLLDALAEAQSEGLIHSREEALWLAEEKLLQIRSNSAY